jgi:hypothetical protein
VSARTAAVCLVALVAAGCGGGDDATDDPAAAPAVDLTVTLRPEGPDGPARQRQIRCEQVGPNAGTAVCRGLAGLTPAQLKPVPANVACTQIYGGPASASVRGTLLGKQVDAQFKLTNGCEIERWDRNRVLLDDAPSRG